MLRYNETFRFPFLPEPRLAFVDAAETLPIGVPSSAALTLCSYIAWPASCSVENNASPRSLLLTRVVMRTRRQQKSAC